MNEVLTAVPRAAQVWKAGARAAIVATVVNALIYLLADGLIDGQIAVPQPPPDGDVRQLPIVAVIAVTAAAILLGTVAFRLAVRFSRRHAAVAVLAVGAVLTLLSLDAPLSVDVDSSIKLALVPMHLVVGAAFIGFLAPLLRSTRRSPTKTTM
jgi:hypothetical protein